MARTMEEPTCSIVYLLGRKLRLKYVGTGKITGRSTEQPWYHQPISEILIEDGVTEIDVAAFADMPELERIWLPPSLRAIRSEAFAGCPKLDEICYCANFNKLRKVQIHKTAMPEWFYEHLGERQPPRQYQDFVR